LIVMQKVFADFVEIEKVIIYGSRAKGNFKPSSDIDLTLIGSNIDLTVRDRISAEIDDLLLPYRVDLSIYSLLSNQYLIDHINRIGEIFYLKKEPSV
jgi:uncharacterized protein